jgi:hypothetical protein
VRGNQQSWELRTLKTDYTRLRGERKPVELGAEGSQDRLHQAIRNWRESSAKNQQTADLSGCLVRKTSV